MSKGVMIDTPRLKLRRFSMGDSNDIFEILSDRQTTLDDGGFLPFDSKSPAFYALMQQFTTHERFSIVEKLSGKVIGMINLMPDDRAVRSLEIGFVINKDYRRRGYMYEAVSALLARYFETQGIEMFTVSHFTHNHASEGLIKKLGFTFEGISRKAMKHAELGVVDIMCYYLERPETAPSERKSEALESI